MALHAPPPGDGARDVGRDDSPRRGARGAGRAARLRQFARQVRPDGGVHGRADGGVDALQGPRVVRRPGDDGGDGRPNVRPGYPGRVRCRGADRLFAHDALPRRDDRGDGPPDALSPRPLRARPRPPRPHHDKGDGLMRHHDHHTHAGATGHGREAFPTDTDGLSAATAPETIDLRDGDAFDLRIHPVRKRIGDAEVRMLGYNGSIPGPTLHVNQGSEITVNVTNDGDVETTVHWHGLRLENRYDGVPEETQPPIPPGGTFAYKVQFPDPGLYWYHPHIREDFAQEMGLYAPIVVEPSDPSYWPAADRQLTITLDDVLLEDGKLAPFGRSGPNFVAMGRFGNVMLINGETGFSGEVTLGEVVRLYLVNTANTRIFNFALRGGARMKLVGGDSGRHERETFVEEVLLSPSERAVVDVLFDTPGEARLEHRTPDHVYDLGSFSVAGNARGDAAE